MTLQSPTIWPGVEDSGHLLLARVVGWDGALVTQATFTGISYACYDLETGELTGSGALTVNAVIFDTEQSGGNWDYDDGYNFEYMLPATCVPSGGHRYVVEVWADPVSGEDFRIPAEAFTIQARAKRGD